MCDKKFRQCPVSCGNWQNVNAYYQERERQIISIENNYRETDGHHIQVITFQQWLIARKAS